MATRNSPPLNAIPRRISFAHASSLMLAQALTDASERQMRHFPTLSSATWGDMLQQLQPDLLVAGKTVTFDWPALMIRVKGLAIDPALPAGLKTYQRQNVPILVEMQTSPQAGVDDAIQSAPGLPINNFSPSVPEPLGPSLSLVMGNDDLIEERREGPALVQSLSKMVQKNTLGPARHRKTSNQRTVRDIVEHHPRGNGRFGFTVRELCTTMRISAASLTEARRNPGHLSVNAVIALSEAMGEHPLRVLADISAEAASKKRRLRKKRVTQFQQRSGLKISIDGGKTASAITCAILLNGIEVEKKTGRG